MVADDADTGVVQGSSCQDCSLVQAVYRDQAGSPHPQGPQAAAALDLPGQEDGRRGEGRCSHCHSYIAEGYSEGTPVCSSCEGLPV